MEIKKITKWYYNNEFLGRLLHNLVYCLKKELRGCLSVLDLGCGSGSPLKYCHNLYSVGVDAFKPYIQESQREKIHNKYILANITEVGFRPKSFDAAILINVLEHLEKNKGKILLRKVEHWVRKKIIIVTPNGFLPQEKFDENLFQIHRSGWKMEELTKQGYKVYGMSGLKFLQAGRTTRSRKLQLLFLFFAEVSQLFTYYYPKLAFETFYVKKLCNK